MEEYVDRAEHAEQQARRARNEDERRAVLEMAKLWRGLAERARVKEAAAPKASD